MLYFGKKFFGGSSKTSTTATNNSTIRKSDYFDFFQLPFDLKVEIFGWLEIDELKTSESVCKEWKGLATHESVWKKLYDRYRKLFRFSFPFLTSYFYYDRDFGQKAGTWDSEDSKLFWSVKNNFPHSVNIILREAKDKNPEFLESQKDAGFSPLYRACQKGHLEVVKILIKHGADIEAKKGYTYFYL